MSLMILGISSGSSVTIKKSCCDPFDFPMAFQPVGVLMVRPREAKGWLLPLLMILPGMILCTASNIVSAARISYSPSMMACSVLIFPLNFWPFLELLFFIGNPYHFCGTKSTISFYRYLKKLMNKSSRLL